MQMCRKIPKRDLQMVWEASFATYLSVKDWDLHIAADTQCISTQSIVIQCLKSRHKKCILSANKGCLAVCRCLLHMRTWVAYQPDAELRIKCRIFRNKNLLCLKWKWWNVPIHSTISVFHPTSLLHAACLSYSIHYVKQNIIPLNWILDSTNRTQFCIKGYWSGSRIFRLICLELDMGNPLLRIHFVQLSLAIV